MSKVNSFSYCLESGRKWDFDDYYELYELKGNVAKFRVYDANMYPAPNFETWGKEAITEVVSHVKNKFHNFNGLIYLDGYKIDLTKGEK